MKGRRARGTPKPAPRRPAARSSANRAPPARAARPGRPTSRAKAARRISTLRPPKPASHGLPKPGTTRVRQDFPLLRSQPHLAYLDNACMSLKPRIVIDRIRRYYEETPFCAGRSVYDGARFVSEEVWSAREAIAQWIGARNADSIVFTRNATEALNLVAHAFPFAKGDIVLGTDKEHNSNLVPWQVAEPRVGLRHEVLPARTDASFDLDAFAQRLARRDVRLVAMAHASNLDGSSIPAKEVVALAHEAGAAVLLDGAQAAPHENVDVESLGVDYYALSSHKALGPTGIGALYIAPNAPALGPFLVGGDTVVETSYRTHELAESPSRYEAGLQDYAGILGAGEAARYLHNMGMDAIRAHEARLNAIATEAIGAAPGVRILGPSDPADRGGILSFTLEGVDPHEIAILLHDKENILIRSGDHCVHSWFHAHGVAGSARASFYLYNTEAEARRFGDAIADLARRFRGFRT
ncbi:MAG: aminotransferase class V-fold PLP-dependent enzyme [Thermoplasmatota archaeon]